MYPVAVVIADILADEVVEMLLAANQKVVQALVLDRLGNAFTARGEAGAWNGQLDRFDAFRRVLLDLPVLVLNNREQARILDCCCSMSQARQVFGIRGKRHEIGQ
jgi:hypothetical protein